METTSGLLGLSFFSSHHAQVALLHSPCVNGKQNSTRARGGPAVRERARAPLPEPSCRVHVRVRLGTERCGAARISAHTLLRLRGGDVRGKLADAEERGPRPPTWWFMGGARGGTHLLRLFP